MNPITPDNNLSALKERADRLARQKSHLQLISGMMQKLGIESGLENTTASLLNIILQNIGGVNATLYYLVDKEIFVRNIQNEISKVETITDEIVNKVFTTRKFIEVEHNFKDTKLHTTEFTNAFTWVCPLMVGKKLIGVIKIDDLHITSQEFKDELPTFFSYAATLLKNDILKHINLKNIEVSLQNEQQLNEELHASNSQYVALNEEYLTLNQELRHANDELIFANEKIKQSENKYKALIENISIGIFQSTLDGKFLHGNSAILGITGFENIEEFLSTPVLDLYVNNSDRDIIIKELQEKGVVKNVETQFRKKNGDVYWSAINATLLKDTGGESKTILGSIEDITERKQAEEALQLLNRKLRAISNCNQVLIRAVNEQSLLNDICRIVCEDANYLMAWVGFGEHDKVKSIRPVAWAGIETGFLNEIQLTWADTELGQCPTGTALRTGSSSVLQDFSTDPRVAYWRGVSSKSSFRSCLALALRDNDGKTFGTLTIYSGEYNAFTSDEIGLLEELADDLAFGITTLRARTIHKRAEETLRGNEAKLGEATRIAHVGYLERDFLAGKITLSEETCRIFGLPLQNRILPLNDWDEQWIKLIHPDDQSRVGQAFYSALSDGPSYNVEYRILRDDGKMRNIHSYADITRDESGIPIRMFGTMIDITEHVLLENEIKQNEFRLNSLVELRNKRTLPIHEVYNFILNKSIELTKSKVGFLGFVDEKEENVEIFSWSESVMAKCTISDPGINFCISQSGLWGEVIRQRSPIIINDYSSYNLLKKGLPKGHVKIDNFTSVPFFDNEKVRVIVALANKETDYNNTDIIQLKLLLEGMWAIIKEQQYQSDLVTAKEKAEESNRLKTEFLHNMSHEIRTPMNGIIGFTRLLDNPDLTTEKKKQFSKIINSSSEQLLRIIDDILEISQLETKQIKAFEENVCLNDLLLGLFLIFDIKAKEKKIPLYLIKGLPDPKSNIITDKTKLNKVIGNLLENALKFTHDGFIELGYQLKDDKVEIFVKDTGIGISSKKQEIIFERFSQEEKDFARLYGGLGLGLSIAKENTELLGGKITLLSEKGKGSTFLVTIPFKPVITDREISGKEPGKGPTEGKSNLFTIMIAEDEEVNYLYLEELLEKSSLNIRIIHARNGLEALEICKTNKEINLILMDIKMPEMNGYEATRLIKEFWPDLPIVAQTSYSIAEDRDKAKAAGCDDFISKPISYETINSILARYLKVG